jgi:sugar transferase (PEP-CTERM/EpsH1 system associated)
MTDPQSLPLVCHIIHRLDYGGLENGLVNLINRLPADHYRHAVVCLTEATDFRRRIERPDVPIVEIGKRQGKDPGAYLKVWRVLRRLRPRVVHTRNLPALDMLAVAALAGVPRLVHGEHGLDVLELDGGSRKYNALRRLSRLVVDRYVTVSHDLGRWLVDEVGIPPGRVTTIYNGVDTGRFRPGPAAGTLPEGFAPPGSFVIGTIGRLETVKDQPTLAAAFCRMLELRPDLRDKLRLVVAGDGALRGEVEAILARQQASGLAWLPGFRSDAPDLLRACDVFVLPSLREGISNTILEAMATAKPVIATAVGGNPEIVKEGVTGTLVPPSDPATMADRLLAYVDDPGRAEAHGSAGLARVLEKFSMAAMLDGYGAIYRDLIGLRP